MAYRGAIIGLGWMGMLYDLAQRMGEWHVDDIERPTPELDIHRRFPYHERHRPRSAPSRGPAGSRRNGTRRSGRSPR